jgi:hypothetical protein
VFDRTKKELSNMNDLSQSSEREGSTRFAFLSSRFPFVIKPSVAVWAPIPLRLIVGYGFMEHGFAKLSKGPEVFAAILHTIGVPAPHYTSSAASPSCSELSFPWLACRWRGFYLLRFSASICPTGSARSS